MKQESIDGEWFIYGPNSEAKFGILKFAEGGLMSLTVKIIQAGDFEKVMVELFTESSARKVVETILGHDAQGRPITLFACHSSVSGTPSVITHNISCLAAVRGFALSSWSELAVRTVKLADAALHRWLEQKPTRDVKLPDGTPAWTYPQYEQLVFEVCDGVRLRIDRSVTRRFSWDEQSIRPDARIWLHFATPRSPSEVSDVWVPWVSRLLSLLVGSLFTFSEVECYAEDPFLDGYDGLGQSGELVRQGGSKSNRDLYPHNMLAPFTALEGQLPQILQRWYQVSSRLEPVVDLFAFVEFQHALHSEAMFLFLVQALEVYHARSGHFTSQFMNTELHQLRVAQAAKTVPDELREWVLRVLTPANHKFLNDRLAEIFSHRSSEAAKLFTDIDEISERIRYTRNHLTHYNGNTESPKYIREREMLPLNRRLVAMLWVLLLSEIGVEGKPITKVVARELDASYVMLGEA